MCVNSRWIPGREKPTSTDRPTLFVSHASASDEFVPASVAAAWHRIGCLHEETGQYEDAEPAYRESLAIKVRRNDAAGQASTLNQLGNPYDRMKRLEDAAALLRQAADIFGDIGDAGGEGLARSDLANTPRKLNRLAAARAECCRAIEFAAPYGHAAKPWLTGDILSEIETADGRQQAAAEARRRGPAMRPNRASSRNITGDGIRPDREQVMPVLLTNLDESNRRQVDMIAERIGLLADLAGREAWTPMGPRLSDARVTAEVVTERDGNGCHRALARFRRDPKRTVMPRLMALDPSSRQFLPARRHIGFHWVRDKAAHNGCYTRPRCRPIVYKPRFR